MKTTTDILTNDFKFAYERFLKSEINAQKSLGMSEAEFVSTFLRELPTLESLIDGASGTVDEKVIFEGILAFTIISLVGCGKLSSEAADFTAENYSQSYDLTKKHIPYLKKYEETEESDLA